MTYLDLNIISGCQTNTVYISLKPTEIGVAIEITSYYPGKYKKKHTQLFK